VSPSCTGTFLSPALLQAFLSGSDWAFGQPKASGPGGTQELYRQVAEQLGCTVFVPLFIGELIQV
jgi:solute carrier family 10 (sodium/bile acid cotransporter), member 7